VLSPPNALSLISGKPAHDDDDDDPAARGAPVVLLVLPLGLLLRLTTPTGRWFEGE